MPLFAKTAQKNFKGVQIKSIAVSNRFDLVAVLLENQNFTTVRLYRFDEDTGWNEIWQIDQINLNDLPENFKVFCIEDICWRPDGQVLAVLYLLTTSAETDKEKIPADSKMGYLRYLNLETGREILSNRCIFGQQIAWLDLRPNASGSATSVGRPESSLDIEKYFKNFNIADAGQEISFGPVSHIKNTAGQNQNFSELFFDSKYFLKFEETGPPLLKSQEILDEFTKINKLNPLIRQQKSENFSILIIHSETCLHLYAFGLFKFGEIQLSNENLKPVVDGLKLHQFYGDISHFKSFINLSTNLPKSVAVDFENNLNLFIGQSHQIKDPY